MKKSVLITGAGRGIGKATAKVFSDNGYEVITPTRQQLDLLNPQSIADFVKEYEKFTFDAIINNAGCNDIHLVEDITDDEIENMINVNLSSPIRLLRGWFPI